MARLTEIQDGSDSEDDVRPSASTSKQTPRAGLTQDEQEQILHKSGLIEKLGLPKDFVTMDEAQAQLDALNKKKSKAYKKAAAQAEAGDDSDDDYGVASDHEFDGDDTANRLMEEQSATEMSPKVESILDLVIWTMPFGFMYTLLDVLVRQQYGETVGLQDEAMRLVKALPGKISLRVTTDGLLPSRMTLIFSSLCLCSFAPFAVLAFFIHYSKFKLRGRYLSTGDSRSFHQGPC